MKLWKLVFTFAVLYALYFLFVCQRSVTSPRLWVSPTSSPEHPGQLFTAAKSLNGSHGEWTASDDTSACNFSALNRTEILAEASRNRRKQPHIALGNKHGPGKTVKELDVVQQLVQGKALKKNGEDLSSTLNTILSYRKAACITDHTTELVHLRSTLDLALSEQRSNHQINLEASIASDLNQRQQEILELQHSTSGEVCALKFESMKDEALRLLSLETDEDVLTARKAKIAALVKFNRETLADRTAIAEDDYRMADLAKNGPHKSESKIKAPPKFEKLDVVEVDQGWEVPITHYPNLNVNASNKAKLRALNVELQEGPLFLQSERESWGKWFGRAALQPFYKMKVNVSAPDVQLITMVHKDYNMEMTTGVGLLQETKLLKWSDTALHHDLRDHYKFCGFQSSWITTLFQDASWLTVNHFDRYRIVRVHPHIYHAAMVKALGRAVNKNFLDQVTRDLSEYLDYVEPDLYSASVAAGVQSASMINYTSGVSAQGKVGIDTIAP